MAQWKSEKCDGNSNTMATMPAKRQLVPPEGGYGWFIVLAYAIANLIGIPTTSNFGLIFKDKFEQMKMPAADLTLIININSALSMSLGFINGPLLRRFGYRSISVIAAILFSLGLVLTAMVDSVIGFIMTYGVITAIGYGLSNGSFALALSSYFRVRLNRASGVAMTLAGIGPILYPPLIQYLLINYDVNGCMMIIGAVALHMLIGAVLLQPIEWHLVSASNANDIDAKDQKSCDFVSKCSLCHPAPMRTVTTLQSIGKLSDASFVHTVSSRPHLSSETTYGLSETRSHFSIDHDIDTQSIYGFDAIIHRQPSFAIPDQETIVRNFSRRTLCNNSFSLNPPHTVNMARLSCSNQNLSTSQSHVPPPKPLRWFETESMDEAPPKPPRTFETASIDSQLPPPKPLRWFESGSTESVHLGSSAEIFNEPTQSPHPITTKTQRTSSIFTPFRRQSLFVQALKKNIISSNRLEIESETKPKEDGLDETVTYLPENAVDDGIDDEIVHRSPCCAAFKWMVEFFDLDLLRDNIYLNLMIGMSISLFAEINFAILTPFILYDLDFGTNEIPLILSVIAIADLIARFFSPFVADYFKWSTQMAYTISLAMLIITRAGMLVTTTYWEMILVAISLGVAKGLRNVYMSIVIPSYIPLDRLASASGIQMFANGLAMIVLGPVLGLIKDFTGSYTRCIIFLNFITLIAVIMYSAEMCYTHYQRKREKEPDRNES